MPSRIIREKLLDSERYWSLSSDTARMLFTHIVLVADDLGNAEAGPGFVRRRLLGGTGTDEAIAKLLGELADVDLVRIYHVGGKRFAHVPRFRQRVRSVIRSNPRPPRETECEEIQPLADKLSGNCPPNDSESRTNDGLSEVKRSEANRSESNKSALPHLTSTDLSTPPGLTLVDSNKIAIEKIARIAETEKQKTERSGQDWQNPTWVAETAKTFGIELRTGESRDAFRDRVFEAVRQRRQG